MADEAARTAFATQGNLGAHANRAASKAVALADLDMTAEQATAHLRRKITMQMTSGAYGLMRCWVIFRNKSGSTKDGITYEEFCRGLRAYGLPLAEEVSRAMFAAADRNNDGHMQIREFIDTIMGRCVLSLATVPADRQTYASLVGGTRRRRTRCSRRAAARRTRRRSCSRWWTCGRTSR